MTLSRRCHIDAASPALEEPEEALHSSEDGKATEEVVPAQPTSATITRKPFCPSGLVGLLVSLVLMGLGVWHLQREIHGLQKELATLATSLAQSRAQQEAWTHGLEGLKQHVSHLHHTVEKVAGAQETVVLAEELEALKSNQSSLASKVAELVAAQEASQVVVHADEFVALKSNQSSLVSKVAELVAAQEASLVVVPADEFEDLKSNQSFLASKVAELVAAQEASQVVVHADEFEALKSNQSSLVSKVAELVAAQEARQVVVPADEFEALKSNQSSLASKVAELVAAQEASQVVVPGDEFVALKSNQSSLASKVAELVAAQEASQVVVHADEFVALKSNQSSLASKVAELVAAQEASQVVVHADEFEALKSNQSSLASKVAELVAVQEASLVVVPADEFEDLKSHQSSLASEVAERVAAHKPGYMLSVLLIVAVLVGFKCCCRPKARLKCCCRPSWRAKASHVVLDDKSCGREAGQKKAAVRPVNRQRVSSPVAPTKQRPGLSLSIDSETTDCPNSAAQEDADAGSSNSEAVQDVSAVDSSITATTSSSPRREDDAGSERGPAKIKAEAKKETTEDVANDAPPCSMQAKQTQKAQDSHSFHGSSSSHCDPPSCVVWLFLLTWFLLVCYMKLFIEPS